MSPRPRPRGVRLALLVVAASLLGLAGCGSCGSSSLGNPDALVVAPTAPPPTLGPTQPPPPPLGPPTEPSHVNVTPDVAQVLGGIRSAAASHDLALLRGHVAQGGLDYVGPAGDGHKTPDQAFALLRDDANLVADLARAVDRGCAGDTDDQGGLTVVCPAEAGDDEFTGTSFTLGQRSGAVPSYAPLWKIVAIDVVR